MCGRGEYPPRFATTYAMRDPPRPSAPCWLVIDTDRATRPANVVQPPLTCSPAAHEKDEVVDDPCPATAASLRRCRDTHDDVLVAFISRACHDAARAGACGWRSARFTMLMRQPDDADYDDDDVVIDRASSVDGGVSKRRRAMRCSTLLRVMRRLAANGELCVTLVRTTRWRRRLVQLGRMVPLRDSLAPTTVSDEFSALFHASRVRRVRLVIVWQTLS